MLSFGASTKFWMLVATRCAQGVFNGNIGVAKTVIAETLPSAVAKQEKRRQSTDTASLLGGDSPGYGAIHESTSASQTNQPKITDGEAPVPFRGLLIPQVLKPLSVYSALAFVSSSIQVLLPLMYSTSIPVGGLGFDAYRIGIILSAFSLVNAFVQLFLFGKLIRRFGPRTLLVFTHCGYAIHIGIYPVLGFLMRRAGRVDGKIWTVMVVQLASRLTNGLGWGGWTSELSS
ncbi:hypothetical protein DXG01_005362 [Tephrocybe rancida]|nr:hypothetical protein DXG01_005362 [Tephrocybe rancida]